MYANRDPGDTVDQTLRKWLPVVGSLRPVIAVDINAGP